MKTFLFITILLAMGCEYNYVEVPEPVTKAPKMTLHDSVATVVYEFFNTDSMTLLQRSDTSNAMYPYTDSIYDGMKVQFTVGYKKSCKMTAWGKDTIRMNVYWDGYFAYTEKAVPGSTPHVYFVDYGFVNNP